MHAFIFIITQFPLTIVMKSRTLKHYMNVIYVVGYNGANRLLFQCIVSILMSNDKILICVCKVELYLHSPMLLNGVVFN
jgi:hypothetical protein